MCCFVIVASPLSSRWESVRIAWSVVAERGSSALVFVLRCFDPSRLPRTMPVSDKEGTRPFPQKALAPQNQPIDAIHSHGWNTPRLPVAAGGTTCGRSSFKNQASAQQSTPYTPETPPTTSRAARARTSQNQTPAQLYIQLVPIRSPEPASTQTSDST